MFATHLPVKIHSIQNFKFTPERSRNCYFLKLSFAKAIESGAVEGN